MRRRLLALTLAFSLIGVLAACSKSSDAGDGYRLSADQLRGTTTSTTPPKPPHTTEVATSNVAELEVFEQKPSTDGSTTTTTAVSSGFTAKPSSFSTGSQARADLPPIPRVGLNSAGSARTATGWTYSNPTYFKNPLALDVVENDGEWLKVLLPARPNGTEGWVRASDVTLTESQYHAELDVSDRHLKVFNGDDLVVETDVVVGKAATPTPLGHFYVNEKIKQSNAGGAYGPWILSTNGYSDALNDFDGGLPVLGFHGTNQPGLIGSAASNGCVRMPNEVVTQLADEIPVGMPIDIVE